MLKERKNESGKLNDNIEFNVLKWTGKEKNGFSKKE